MAHITHNNPVLPQAGDTVTYLGQHWTVEAFDFNSDDLRINDGARTTTICRLDIE